MFSHDPTKTTYRYEAELVGGPFDGQRVGFIELPPQLALPVNENMFCKAAGTEPGPPAPASSIAFYKLTNRHGQKQYHFRGACSPRQAAMESWSG